MIYPMLLAVGALGTLVRGLSGMVNLTVDGQLRRVLAQLAEGDPRAIKIGEKVVVVEVDTKHNTCRVASL